MFLRSRWFFAAFFVVLAIGMVIPAVYLLAQGRSNAEIVIIPPPDEGLEGNPAAVGGKGTLETVVPVDIQVYVHGAVQRPGVYELVPGARVMDAIKAAGGPSPEADLVAINMAQRVVDEGYYYVPKEGETPPSASSKVSPPGAMAHDASALPRRVDANPAQGLIDLNTATNEELTTLPGIGQVRAQSIVDHREQHGPFASAEAITDVHGIGQGIYQQVRDLVTVGGR